MTIVVVIAIAVIVILVIKVWLYKLLKFKVDESSILNFLKESGEGSNYQSTDSISKGTNLHSKRVTQVCVKSKAILRHANEKESWFLA